MSLTTNQKSKVRQSLHRAYSASGMPMPWTKAQADAAITAADDWIDSQAAEYNAALPAAFRNSASSNDKTVLLLTVVMAQRLTQNGSAVAALQSVVADLAQIVGVE